MRIGNYELVERIGRGGMGEVWSALHHELRMPCVVKLLRRELMLDERSRRMFINEARIAAQLRHSQIVNVWDAGQHGERLYLVMDWVDGIDLRRLLREHVRLHGRPLSPRLAAHIVGEVLQALHYTHGRTIGDQGSGVVHRDIKPSNILVSSQGEVFLTDFGVAGFAESLTWHSTVYGTPHYMAPEQLRGHPCRASDLYSLGAVLHEMLAGEPIIPHDYKLGKVLRHMRADEPTPPLSVEVPIRLDHLRRRLLTKEPAKRPSAREALEILDGWTEHRNRASEMRALYARLFGPARSGITGVFDREEVHRAVRERRGLSMGTPDGATNRRAPSVARASESAFRGPTLA